MHFTPVTPLFSRKIGDITFRQIAHVHLVDADGTTLMIPRKVTINEIFYRNINGFLQENYPLPWLCHGIETFAVLLALCVGNYPASVWFSAKRASNTRVYAFLDVNLNQLWNKRYSGLEYEMPYRSCDVTVMISSSMMMPTPTWSRHSLVSIVLQPIHWHHYGTRYIPV